MRLPTFILTLPLLALVGCSHQLPTSGPSRDEVEQASAAAAASTIKLVDVTAKVAAQLLEQKRQSLFSQSLGSSRRRVDIGSGDTLEVTIWEAPPATLFGGGSVDARQPATTRGVAMPEQTVDLEGLITVPFAGRVRAAGRSPQEVAQEIASRLTGKANQPEVVVRVLRQVSSTVTVVGDVATSVRMPVTAGGERLLDALAAAGGVRQPVNKVSVQITRGRQVQALPLDLIIRDPEQNIPLQPGDVVTALHQPLAFTALGATGKNDEIAFEAQGISLAQALARSGGLNDARSNPQGVFIFRLEPAPQAQPQAAGAAVDATPAAAGRVPVVYRFDLRDPGTFFVMQNFEIQHRDVLYVSNAPAAELQKFLNLVFSVVYPVLSTIQIYR